MTDADALSDLVRAGLRNPARIVVKVQAKRSKRPGVASGEQKGEIIEERRIPAGYAPPRVAPCSHDLQVD